MCDVGFYWIHPGVQGGCEAETGLRASGGKQSMLRRKMGRKSKSAHRGDGGGEEGQCSGGRHTSTARMEVHAGEDMLA